MRKITWSLVGGTMAFVLLSFTFSAFNPNIGLAQYTEYGIATFYSDLFEGRSTASGEVYHANQLTAAHKSLPYGTIVRVTRLDNKKSIKVRINDRGAFNKGRIIDLSKAAAQRLSMVDDGKANVKLEVLNEKAAPKASTSVAINEAPSGKELTQKTDSAKKDASAKAKAKANAKAKAKAATKKTYHLKGKKSAKATKKGAQKSTKVVEAEIVTASNYQDFDLYKVQVMRPKKDGYGVQVGLLENYENVFKFIADLQEDFFKNILMSVEEGAGGSQYRIILGPFPTKDQAQSYRNSLAKKKKLNGFVINLKNLAKAK